MKWGRLLPSAVLALSATRLFAVSITEYPLPAGSQPLALVVGPDGNMWFPEQGTNAIGRITSQGVIDHFPAASAGCGPAGLAVGSDGNLWYTCASKPKVGRMDATGATVDFVTASQPLGGIASGPDGNLWFGVSPGIGLMTTTGFYSLELSVGSWSPIVNGGNSDVWTAIPHDGAVRRFALPGGLYGETREPPYAPTYLAWCPDLGGMGLVWSDPAMGFVRAQMRLGNVDTSVPGDSPQGVACGKGSTIWFAAHDGNYVESLDVETHLSKTYPIPTAAAGPQYVTLGPDGSVWFTEAGATQIGRLWEKPPPDVDGNGTVDVADVFFLVNFLFAGGPPPVQ